MNRFIISLALGFILLSGCSGNLSPLSPRMNQKLNNQNGKIDELKTNQDSVAAEIGKLRNDTQVTADKINSFQQQQGMLNKENSGVQIFQGDGALIAVIVLAALGMFLIFYYRSEALKAKQVNNILSHQIVQANDPDLEDQVFLAAMRSEVEPEVYHLMVKKQTQLGIARHLGLTKS